jgi:hypothetical protein
MATWTEIDDSRLEPGKPIRSVDGLALRDNPVAIAEGAENAPRIYTAAMKKAEPGDIVVGRLREIAISSQTTRESDVYNVRVGGVVRLTLNQALSNPSGTASGTCIVRVNGVSRGGWTIPAGSSVAYDRSIDLTVSLGDYIHIEIDLFNPGGGFHRVSNIALRSKYASEV